jgi:hypothetical protein
MAIGKPTHPGSVAAWTREPPQEGRTAALVLGALGTAPNIENAPRRLARSRSGHAPNAVIVLIDDMGFGYRARSRPSPSQGIRPDAA